MIIEQISISVSYIIIAGDFNVHVEKLSDPHALALLELFDSFQLFNRISEPTHILGGTFDLIVSSDNLPTCDCIAHPSGVDSDHSFISVRFPIKFRSSPVKIERLVRSWNRLDEGRFISLVQESSFNDLSNLKDPDQALDLFNSEIKIIIDTVAPLHAVTSTVSAAPWFDDECRVMKKRCRRIERLFRRDPNSISKK